MRNLRNIQQSSFNLECTTVPDAPITASTWDISTDTLICAFGPSGDEGHVELTRLTSTGESALITSWEGGASDKIISLHHLADSLSTCVIFASGDIVLVREDPAVEVEILGSVADGISAAAWSPDEEILAITTVSRTLTLMSREFEPIEEVPFSIEDFKASRHVSVGWGKAETQFQGKHAKAQSLRDPTVPEKIDQGKLSPHDDGTTVITWRGDGSYLAISAIENQERRMIRVYSREGQLDSVSEPVDGFESPLSWRPVGNLMAGIQRLPDRVDVIFFERNGLRHGQFALKTGARVASTDLNVGTMIWNGDSTVLAICLQDRVQLWSMGNYHWYLKQELELPFGVDRCALIWHPEKPLKFAITMSTMVNINTFIWYTATGMSTPPNDSGIVGVVDGDKLKITAMRVANIPPPMSLCEADLEATPVDIAISPFGTRIVTLQQVGVDLISWSFKPIIDPQVVRKVAVVAGPETFRQVCFVGEKTICLLGDNKNGQSILRFLSLGFSGSVEQDELHVLQSSSICTFRSAGDGEALLLQEQNGNVVRYNVADKTESPVCKLPVVCPWMEAITVEGQIIVFGLSQGGRLYANERLLASSCTSFSVTDAHLIYTTSQHVISFIHLTPNIHDLEVPSDEVSGDERRRNVERGSRLVCVMPSTFSLVLQMPRGNLETIYPRALVLAGVRRSIEARDYKTAFLACRNNRVDLNLIHDYAPNQFLECIELFVQQLKKIEYIDLFLSQLREEDVTKTMYRETLVMDGALALELRKDVTSGNKVNGICNAFIDNLSKKHISKNIQNIITAHVCKSPPDHESALNLIATLKGKEFYEQAITHICFLCDINKLYDTSLGIYDLGVALMVAQQAQKDPREYLPFLQSLQEMDELRRRFTIDDRLGRFSKALKSLHEMGPNAFEETRRYAKQKELYTEALGLYKYEQECLMAIMQDYATFLFAVSRFREAGYAYEFLGELDLAIESYQNAGLWQECLFVATQAQISPEAMDTLSSAVADSLYDNKDYKNAATVYLEYRNDVKEAAKALCKGCHFGDAMRVVTLKSKPELLEDVVDPALMETFGSTSEMLAECKGQLAAQTSRIVELQQKNLSDPLAYFDGIIEADAPDNVSLAPTNASTSASLFTRYTGNTLGTALTGESRKTSKNRRKDERKRARGKKGSVYEEEYLMNSIRRLMERVDSVRGDTERLIEAMFRRHMRDNAAAIQKQFQELLLQLEGCVKIVFVPEINTPQVQMMGAQATEGRSSLSLQATPFITHFDGLSLL
ncbi:IkappaB kinase complex, IKAP component [Wilcoxina mikolae CBS 423.85]|nr:IkappaB kinase complex, IKAP component [Wilcoxina mikolae CBS 423.85]